MLEHSPVQVPGNASRYHSNQTVAKSQPHGRLGLAVSPQGHIFNAAFKQELIRYDQNYLTTSCKLSGGGAGSRLSTTSRQC